MWTGLKNVVNDIWVSLIELKHFKRLKEINFLDIGKPNTFEKVA